MIERTTTIDTGGTQMAATPQEGWTQEEGIAFEVARDILGQLIGYAAAQIDAEQADPGSGPPDRPTWRERQQEWTARRLALKPADPDVERVLQEEGTLLQHLRAGKGTDR
jgi:hypothetical protein